MISFQFVLNFSGKKFYVLSQGWMCLKLLWFYFKGLPFLLLLLFLKARLWKCSAGYTWVLGLEGQPSCHQGCLVPVPNSMENLWGNSFFSHTPGRLSHVLYSSFTAPRGKGSDQNCGVPHTCSLFGCTLFYQHCLPGLKQVDGVKFVLLSLYTSFPSFQD